MTNKTGTASIIHYSSCKCTRIAESVIAVYVFGLVNCFDNLFTPWNSIQSIKKKVPLDGYVNPKTLFNVLVKEANVKSKRLQIDLFSLKKSYSRGDLNSLA